MARSHQIDVVGAEERLALAEHTERLGFVQEAVLREEARGAVARGFHDLVVYGMLEDEWRARARTEDG